MPLVHRSVFGLIVLVVVGAGCGGSARPANEAPSTPPASAVTSTEPVVVSPDACPDDPGSGEPSPWGETHVVELDGGRPLHLRDCETNGPGLVRFTYRGESPIPGLHVVEYQIWEGGGWVIVNEATGEQWHVSGEPNFSPNHDWFATGNADLEALYLRNHLDIWGVEDDSVYLALTMDGTEMWGATGLAWVSNDTLEFQHVTWAEQVTPRRYLDTTVVRIAHTGSEWTPLSQP